MNVDPPLFLQSAVTQERAALASPYRTWSGYLEVASYLYQASEYRPVLTALLYTSHPINTPHVIDWCAWCFYLRVILNSCMWSQRINTCVSKTDRRRRRLWCGRLSRVWCAGWCRVSFPKKYQKLPERSTGSFGLHELFMEQNAFGIQNVLLHHTSESGHSREYPGIQPVFVSSWKKPTNR